jgi:hypothetical protein
MAMKSIKEIKALEEGKCVLEQINDCGWDSDVYVGNCLVDMYVKCGEHGRCAESVQQNAILRCGCFANMVNQISVCKVLQNVDLLSSEVKDWSHFMQDAVPHCGF